MLAALTKVIGISGESIVAVETDAEVKRVNEIAEKAGVLIDAQKTRFSRCLSHQNHLTSWLPTILLVICESMSVSSAPSRYYKY
ncbi:MAG: hypothetical protein Ct9H300mP25_08230 [Acidobacteriota bacterium]|nr:MAG: hypothetical protein Ct9H300mP25_08230 [Acidobacteriota bacterium]